MYWLVQGFRDVKPEDVVSNVPPRDGNIYLFDFKQPHNNVKNLYIPSTPNFNRSTFNPHGISIWQDPSIKHILVYVVNHLSDGDSVEIFEYIAEDGIMNHVKQIRNPLINSPNDVEAVGSDTFYVTNDHYFNSPFMRKLETYLQLAMSTVAFYDGSTNKAHLVASSLAYPNGIHLSLDYRSVCPLHILWTLFDTCFSRFVYVMESNGPDVVVYERNKTDSTVRLVQSIQLADTCDNMFIEPNTGDIWLGCHPRLIDTAKYSETNCSHKAGSQVLRLKLGAERTDGVPFPDYDIDQVFINDGSLLKGSSVAVYYDGKMLVGSPLDKLLYCEVKSLG
jgi:arylesterase/paraoxonase